MRPNVGCIDQHTLDFIEVGGVSEQLEQLGQAAAEDPTPKSIVHSVPRTELARQIAPRNSSPRNIQHGLEEHSLRQDRSIPALVSLGLLDTGLHGCPKFVHDHIPHGVRASNEKSGFDFRLQVYTLTGPRTSTVSRSTLPSR